jgi:hypothetical protein
MLSDFTRESIPAVFHAKDGETERMVPWRLLGLQFRGMTHNWSYSSCGGGESRLGRRHHVLGNAGGFSVPCGDAGRQLPPVFGMGDARPPEGGPVAQLFALGPRGPSPRARFDLSLASGQSLRVSGALRRACGDRDA